MSCIVVGGIVAFTKHFEIGSIAIVFGVFLFVKGAHTLRQSRKAGQDANAVALEWEDIRARLDRGETFDEIAQDLERLRKIEPARTLYYLGDLIRANVGAGGNPEVNEAARILLSRQAASASSESAEKAIETFSRARNVFFVDKSTFLFPNPDQLEGGEPGVFIISRHFLYFLIHPEEGSLGAVFAQGLVKEKFYEWTRIPYLGVAALGIEAVSELREAIHDDFNPEVVGGLKKLFRQPGSLAIPLSTIVALGRARVATKFGVPRERLVVFTKDPADKETRYGFGSGLLFDDQWFTIASDVLRTVCVMEGRLLPLY